MISRRNLIKGGTYVVPTVALLSMTSVQAEAASLPKQNDGQSSQTLPHTGTDVLPIAVGAAGAIAIGATINHLAK